MFTSPGPASTTRTVAKVNPKKSEHVAKFHEMVVLAVGRNLVDVTVLDIAAGTGTVGILSCRTLRVQEHRRHRLLRGDARRRREERCYKS